jgi:Fe-S-cluster containining protein
MTSFMPRRLKLKDRIEELRGKLEAARRIRPEEMALQIQWIGFRCLRCGECCTGEENSVLVFPAEVRRIMLLTGDAWLETVEPPSLGEWDTQGDFHTLEWRLRKEEGSCKFFAGQCRIYDSRPLLCCTYPFYLEEGLLKASECPGLGKPMGATEAEEIASLLVARSVRELEEAALLLEMYEDFPRGQPLPGGACLVHDSEGVHRIHWEALPELRPRIWNGL